jgi:hypothetical protein
MTTSNAAVNHCIGAANLTVLASLNQASLSSSRASVRVATTLNFQSCARFLLKKHRRQIESSQLRNRSLATYRGAANGSSQLAGRGSTAPHAMRRCLFSQSDRREYTAASMSDTEGNKIDHLQTSRCHYPEQEIPLGNTFATISQKFLFPDSARLHFPAFQTHLSFYRLSRT